MSTHRYNSWGRTRRPKNVTGIDGAHVTGSTILKLRALDMNDAANAIPANGVYKTENQRFVHLHASGSSSGCNNVFTYLYASQQWSELKRFDFKTGTDRESIVVGANEHVIVEIGGADLIAFATGSGGLFAAFSTF